MKSNGKYGPVVPKEWGKRRIEVHKKIFVSVINFYHFIKKLHLKMVSKESTSFITLVHLSTAQTKSNFMTFYDRWNAFAPPFNYDSDLDSSLLGDAIARERWCRDFFNKLQKSVMYS